MDIKELDKKQLILLTLLITFVVSIATGIVTVSLMNQMPKTVPQTINNVIQRTIEKVTTVETPEKKDNTIETKYSGETKKTDLMLNSGDVVVSIYSLDEIKVSSDTNIISDNINTDTNISIDKKELGQGIIISDIGLILVETSILNESQNYKIILDKTDFNAIVLKKFSNGFTILKISKKKAVVETPIKTDEVKAIQ